MSSNLKSNIDEAFIRRFQSIIQFPMPNPKDRLQLRQITFPSQVKLAESVDFLKLSAAYELSGSDILNIVQRCCLQARQRENLVISQNDLLDSIKRELSKAGKII